MKEIIRQCIGIDCAKDEHVASFVVMYTDRQVVPISTVTFKNSKVGFEKLRRWGLKFAKAEPFTVVMESTGVYHEQLACYLVDNDFFVSVILPNKAKYFAKTLDIRSVMIKLLRYPWLQWD